MPHILLLVLLTLVPAWSEELPRYARIEILHTNDLHGQLFPFSYGTEENVGGAERRATMIREIRAGSRDPVVVMDAGDVFTRGPMSNIYHGEPDFAVLNAVPYDIITLGNNEFKGADGLEGQRVMFDRIRQALFPIVCANVIRSDTTEPIVPPYAILRAGSLRLGIFGLTAPRVSDYPQAEGLAILDPVETARKIVPELKERSDVVIALTHIGYDLDRALAKAVPEIDVIVGGDSHTWLEQPVVVAASDDLHAFWVGGPVIVQAGEFGKALGRLELYLRLHDERDYQVMSYRGRLHTVTPDILPAADISAVLEKYAAPLAEPIGTVDRDIGGSPLRREEVARWLAEVIRREFEADAGAHSLSGVGGGLRKGAVTQLDAFSMLLFRNDVVLVEMTTDQFAELSRHENVAVSGYTPAGAGKLTVAMENYIAASVPAVADLPAVGTGRGILDIVQDYFKGVPPGR